MDGRVVWFTGLSGAGKTTLANELYKALVRRNIENIEILDGDDIRTNLSKGLGFSREDRDTNVRRIGYVAHLLSKHDVIVIVAAISPYREVREELKRKIPEFVEVYCDCSIDIVTKRDPKGLYKKALAGEISNFTGISDPYEPPMSPDIILKTGEDDIELCLNKLLKFLGFEISVPYSI